MRVLLTGSSGWLGRFLAPRLRAAGHGVLGLDVAPGRDTQIVGSVADRATVDRAFATGIEAVIHAGALHKPDIARYPAQAFVDVNVTGTLNLLEAARAAGHDRFVFTSTTSLMISQAIRDEAGDAAFVADQRGRRMTRQGEGSDRQPAAELQRLGAQLRQQRELGGRRPARSAWPRVGAGRQYRHHAAWRQAKGRRGLLSEGRIIT